MTVRTFTPQEEAHRLACVQLKAAVKADRPRLRQVSLDVRAAQHNRDAQAPAKQSEYHTEKQKARARLLVYGFIRGKNWERMESNYPKNKPLSGWYLQSAWMELAEEVRSGLSDEDKTLIYKYEVAKRG